MKKILLFIALSFSISFYVNAQQKDIPGYKEFASRFGEEDRNTMEKLNADVLDALTRIQGAQNEEKSLQKYFKKKRKLEKKSVPLKKKWIAAYKIYMVAFASTYDMYESWLNNAKIKDSKIRNQVNEIASKADIEKSKSEDLFGKYKKASASAKELKKNVEYNKMKKDLAISANEITSSLKDMVKALQIIFKQQEIIEADDRAWTKATTTNTFDSFVDYIKEFPTGKHVIDAKQRIKEFKDKIAKDRKEKEKLNAKIEYRIQIVAVSKKLSSWKKKRLYSKVNEIEEELDPVDGLYKYYVGHFTKYKEAKQFVARLGIADAFVQSYKNGQKANVLEVLEIERNK